MQSPPARARAEDHNPWLRSGKPCGLDQPSFSRVWQGYLKRQPRRGFHALREGLWRLRNKSGMRPCRGAEALGYGMQSPPARARAESLLKNRNPWLRSGKHCGLDQPRFSRIWQGYLKHQPRRGFHALREGFSPHVLRSSEEVQPL